MLQQHSGIEPAIEQAEILAAEFDQKNGSTAIAGRDVIFLARRGPEPRAMTIGYPGDRSPLLAPVGAVFMAWADDDAVTTWLERRAVTGPRAALYRRVLAETRDRGFSVPRPRPPCRVRSEPIDAAAEHNLTDVLLKTDEMLLLLEDMPDTAEIAYKTIAAPIFDPIGQVQVALSITGPEHPVRIDQLLERGRRLVQSAAIATRQARGRMPGR